MHAWRACGQVSQQHASQPTMIVRRNTRRLPAGLLLHHPSSRSHRVSLWLCARDDWWSQEPCSSRNGSYPECEPVEDWKKPAPLLPLQALLMLLHGLHAGHQAGCISRLFPFALGDMSPTSVYSAQRRTSRCETTPRPQLLSAISRPYSARPYQTLSSLRSSRRFEPMIAFFEIPVARNLGCRLVTLQIARTRADKGSRLRLLCDSRKAVRAELWELVFSRTTSVSDALRVSRCLLHLGHVLSETTRLCASGDLQAPFGTKRLLRKKWSHFLSPFAPLMSRIAHLLARRRLDLGRTA